MHIACKPANIDIIQRLIKAGADGMIRNEMGNTSSHEVSYNTRDKKVFHNLFCVSDFNSSNNTGSNPFTLVCLWNPYAKMITCIGDYTCDIDRLTFCGFTGFYYLCLRDKYDVFEYLLEKCANPFISIVFNDDNGDTGEQETSYNATSQGGQVIIDNYLRLRNTST